MKSYLVISSAKRSCRWRQRLLTLLFSLLIYNIPVSASQPCEGLLLSKLEKILGQGSGGIARLVQYPEHGLAVEKTYFESEQLTNDVDAFSILDHLKQPNLRTAERYFIKKSSIVLEYIAGESLDSTLEKADEAFRLQYKVFLHELADRLRREYGNNLLHSEIYQLGGQSPLEKTNHLRLSARIKSSSGQLVRVIIKPGNIIFDGSNYVVFDPH